MFGKRHNKTYAGVAQLVEQLICNQQVAGSSPITSSTNRDKLSGLSLKYGRVPEWPKGADCKSVVFDFNGSNPFSPTNNKSNRITMRLLLTYTLFYTIYSVFWFFMSFKAVTNLSSSFEYSNIYNIAKGFDVGINFFLLPDNATQKVLLEPWLVSNYSKRIWNNNEQFIERVRQTIKTICKKT